LFSSLVVLLAACCICLVQLVSNTDKPLAVLSELAWCHVTAGLLSGISSSAPLWISVKTLTMLIEFLLQFVSWIHVLFSVGFVQDIQFLYVVHDPVCHCHCCHPPPLPLPTNSYPQLYHLMHLPYFSFLEHLIVDDVAPLVVISFVEYRVCVTQVHAIVEVDCHR